MKNIGRKIISFALIGSLTAGSFAFAAREEAKEKQKSKPIKNVIMMVMDGTSAGATTLARWYKGAPLALDEMASGAVRTYSAESAITDSAPAATAMATGFKSNDKYIGILPSVVNSPGASPISKERAMKPVANVLEGAELMGKATGIIATSAIQHATPAGFSAHVKHRNLFPDIAEQQVYQDIEVVLGGGKEALLPGSGTNNRKDNENMLEIIKKKGYDVVETRDDLLRSTSDKIWGVFADDALAQDMNRPYTRPNEPTLAEMTKKAIETLSKDKDGFFLFVEGSQPDWAAHANDPVGIISEVLAFDKAVAEALSFAKKRNDTLVIAVSDHGNSGITIGNRNTDQSYPETPVSAYVDPLKKARMTLEGAMSQLKADKSNLEEVARLYGLDSLTADEKKKLNESNNLRKTLTELLAARANLGFTTGGHTGEDVFLYTYGPNRPIGTFENTDLAHIMAKAMGFQLSDLNKRLFVNAKENFAAIGATVTIDDTDAQNPKLIVKKGKTVAEFPANKNIMIAGNKTYELEGLVVNSAEQFWVPKQAVKLFKQIQ
ncbi:alkaline phosphatase [Parageobacillus thermoglucosidasius]|uniref:alkaline phosphatase n=1 Tax=Parageobacillus thermoglucosidasius TaxID=1426 RepID=UPI002E22A52E|nr:alkaline phosphatase [Parageobacillus thermoglucosidasius]MED4905886.1 alkaline phosphatase [Parageobacillus thermoglucosidasius]MED4913487.1 alkaline phosphatase [Parageobacillus thermoglucosidasius]MED4946596.1 alkaline phosphatase [Parageobacillus thermoglucosidasius]MED4982159.1 alkaline phosphatase [Parageobacillus thermoglucosidasius]